MKQIFFFVLALCCGSSYAGKMYMALVPTSSEFYAMVSVAEKPCVVGEGNAIYMSETRAGKVAALGCWKLDGNTVKVEWTTGDKVPNTFDFAIFKPISDDGTQAATKGTKTLLTCSATGWIGDILVERDEAGVLTKLLVSGEDVSFSERGTAINFSYKGKNISLSTVNGVFNYETSGFQSYLNNRFLGGGDVKGTGSCKLADASKKF